MKKKCTHCNIEQEIKEFPKNYVKRKDGSPVGDGYRSDCRTCESKRRKKSYNNNPITGILNNVRQRCKKRNILCNITEIDVPIPDLCPILEIPMKRGTKGNYKHSPTIDRIDPSKGYIKGNVRVISMMANRMKSNATEEEIKLFIKNILKYLNDDIV